MRQRASRPMRLTIGLVAAGALTFAACGSDDGTASDETASEEAASDATTSDEGDGTADEGTTADAFCEEITALADSGEATTPEEDIEAFRSMAAAAPEEISDEMDQLVEAFERLQTFDPETASEEEMAEFLAIAEGLEGASTTVEDFARENCPDLPADFFGTE